MVNFIISKKIFQLKIHYNQKKLIAKFSKYFIKIFFFDEKIIILYKTDPIEEFFSKLIRQFLIVKNKAYS